MRKSKEPPVSPYTARSGLSTRYSKGVSAAAKVTSKGQITIPAEVRLALGVVSGDQLVFEVEPDGLRAVVHKLPDFFELAGVVPTPEGWSSASWQEIRDEALRRHVAEPAPDYKP
jgi:AbrB family looped-hinge helix DNA binding protein